MITIHWALLSIIIANFSTAYGIFVTQYHRYPLKEVIYTSLFYLFFGIVSLVLFFIVLPLYEIAEPEIKFYYRLWFTDYFDKLALKKPFTPANGGNFIQNVNISANRSRKGWIGKRMDRHRKALNKKFNYQPKNDT